MVWSVSSSSTWDSTTCARPPCFRATPAAAVRNVHTASMFPGRRGGQPLLSIETGGRATCEWGCGGSNEVEVQDSLRSSREHAGAKGSARQAELYSFRSTLGSCGGRGAARRASVRIPAHDQARHPHRPAARITRTQSRAIQWRTQRAGAQAVFTTISQLFTPPSLDGSVLLCLEALLTCLQAL